MLASRENLKDRKGPFYNWMPCWQFFPPRSKKDEAIWAIPAEYDPAYHKYFASSAPSIENAREKLATAWWEAYPELDGDESGG